MHPRVVAFEKERDGSRAYTSNHPDGIVFEDEELWSLDGLLKKLGIN
jgi:hypothetical protein